MLLNQFLSVSCIEKAGDFTDDVGNLQPGKRISCKTGGQMLMCKALEELRMEGVLQGRTEGIRATVKTCKKFRISKEAIIETIGKEFSMPEKEVAEYVEKYW